MTSKRVLKIWFAISRLSHQTWQRRRSGLVADRRRNWRCGACRGACGGRRPKPNREIGLRIYGVARVSFSRSLHRPAAGREPQGGAPDRLLRILWNSRRFPAKADLAYGAAAQRNSQPYERQSDPSEAAMPSGCHSGYCSSTLIPTTNRKAPHNLGIRHTIFSIKKDPGPTLDAADALAVWDRARVKREIQMLPQFEKGRSGVLFAFSRYARSSPECRSPDARRPSGTSIPPSAPRWWACALIPGRRTAPVFLQDCRVIPSHELRPRTRPGASIAERR